MANPAALHGSGSHGSHAVGTWALHVVIVPDGKFWFAQGLEIDYATQGESLEDARKKFESGLAATIHEHLKVYGQLKNLLRVAPQDAWDLAFSASASAHAFSPASLQQLPDADDSLLPFRDIQFIEGYEAA